MTPLTMFRRLPMSNMKCNLLTLAICVMRFCQRYVEDRMDLYVTRQTISIRCLPDFLRTQTVRAS